MNETYLDEFLNLLLGFRADLNKINSEMNNDLMLEFFKRATETNSLFRYLRYSKIVERHILIKECILVLNYLFRITSTKFERNISEDSIANICTNLIEMNKYYNNQEELILNNIEIKDIEVFKKYLEKESEFFSKFEYDISNFITLISELQ